MNSHPPPDLQLPVGPASSADEGDLGGNRFFDAQTQARLELSSSVTPREFPFFRFLHLTAGSGWYWTEPSPAKSTFSPSVPTT